MMRKLQARVAEDVAFELAESRRNFEDYFESSFEAREVTREEVQEMLDDSDQAYNMFDDIGVEPGLRTLLELENVLVDTACEAIQAAAMCRKWRESIEMELLPAPGEGPVTADEA